MFKSPTKFEFKKKRKNTKTILDIWVRIFTSKLSWFTTLLFISIYQNKQKKSSCFEQKRFNYFETIVIRGARELSYSICTRWRGNKYEHCIFKHQYLKWVLNVPSMDFCPFEFLSLAMRVHQWEFLLIVFL